MARPGITTERQRHVRELSERHGIQVHYQAPGNSHGRAATDARRVLIPRTTGVRSYYVALHEIAHCVLGFDRRALVAPQEGAAWRWAFMEATEPPTRGVQRMVFKALWHYVLRDLAQRPEEEPSNAELFRGPDDELWGFLASLDEGARLLYEATKITARTGPAADARAEVQAVIRRERDARDAAVRRAREKEQLRIYGPPTPARAGDLTHLGASDKAHIWAQDGMFGTRESAVFCGSVGVAHPATPHAPPCKACERLASRRD